MSFLKKIQNIVTGSINDLLTKVENPETVVRQLIRDMERAISEMRNNTASALSSQKLTERRLRKTLDEENEWQKNAETAVINNKDDLAVGALKKKRESTEKVKLLNDQLENEITLVQTMKSELATLEDKIQEARTKLNTLIAKKNAATAKVPNSAKDIINGFDAFEKFENEINANETNIDSKEELKKDFDDENIDETLSKLKQEKEIDEELEALKKKKGN